MGQSGNGKGAGVRNTGKGLVEYNQILNSGYVGVQLGGDYAIVKNNLIDNFCFIKDDGAGIYTSNGSNRTNKGRKITGNIIINAIGAGAGTSSPGSSSAEGIYMDDNTNGVEVTGNTIANGNRGIYFHNSRNIILKGNTLYNHRNGQLYMKHDDLGGPLRDHIITDNIFFSKRSTHMISSISTKADDIDKIGKFNNNYYARPMDDQMGIHNCTYLNTSKQVTSYRDLEGWKTKYGHDDNSKKSIKKLAPYKIKNLKGSGKFLNGSFNSKVSGFANKCVASWSNAGMMDGGYLKLVPFHQSSSVVMGVGTLTAGKNYILRYSVKGAGTMSLSANLRSASYAPNTPVIKRTVSTARTEHEILFSPTTSETSGSLVFTADDKITYYLDNVELYEADASITNPDDFIRFEYNAGNQKKTISLNGSYVDVKNNKHSNSIVLKPYESIILIKDGESVTAPSNESSAVTITSPVNNASFSLSSTVTISATATDKDGSVTKVEFYNGTTLLGSDNTSPYSFTWKNVATGNYLLTAKATDNNGLVTASQDISISVMKSNAPTVSITNPITNAKYTGRATINMSATASDADGKIKKVEFYNGTTLLKIEYNTPYTYTWKNVQAGNYILTAKAYDNNGLVTTSANVLVSVVKQSEVKQSAPVVKIENPINKATYTSPATINMNAIASDPDGKIKKVEFYNGTTLLKIEYVDRYTYAWKNVPAGNYTLTAKAYDNSGNITVSASVLISVKKPKPAINNAAQNPGNNSLSNSEFAVAPGTKTSGKYTEPVSIKVGPNPATNTISVFTTGLQKDKQFKIIISSLSGVIVKSINTTTSNKVVQIDISSLITGAYFMKIISGDMIFDKQFVKM
jgi:parallel beta-helix repeat protein